MTAPEFYVAPDAYNEPTVWRRTDREPEAVLRLVDLAPKHRDAWDALVGHLEVIA
ncbi:MAG: hypothetical protein PGN07_04645 [Aeromicrobium erythreum]